MMAGSCGRPSGPGQYGASKLEAERAVLRQGGAQEFVILRPAFIHGPGDTRGPEHLRTLLLDTKYRVMASPTVYVGNVNSSIIRVAEVFREADLLLGGEGRAAAEHQHGVAIHRIVDCGRDRG
jgi:nucleoside-diphosphate-sugar epimerase